jgi:hypothetical protein
LTQAAEQNGAIRLAARCGNVSGYATARRQRFNVERDTLQYRRCLIEGQRRHAGEPVDGHGHLGAPERRTLRPGAAEPRLDTFHDAPAFKLRNGAQDVHLELAGRPPRD